MDSEDVRQVSTRGLHSAYVDDDASLSYRSSLYIFKRRVRAHCAHVAFASTSVATSVAAAVAAAVASAATTSVALSLTVSVAASVAAYAV